MVGWFHCEVKKRTRKTLVASNPRAVGSGLRVLFRELKDFYDAQVRKATTVDLLSLYEKT